MMQNIEHEYQSKIDKFSQDIIIAQIELLLKLCRTILSPPVYNPENSAIIKCCTAWKIYLPLILMAKIIAERPAHRCIMLRNH